MNQKGELQNAILPAPNAILVGNLNSTTSI